MTGAAFDRVVEAFESQGLAVSHKGGGRIAAQAPGHSPNDRSVTVTAIDGQVLLYSHSDPTDVVLGALGLTMADLFDSPQGVDYRYSDGRIVRRTPDKKFSQRGNTKGGKLFNIENIALDPAYPIYVCEGEKDVLAIESIASDATAVCSAMGAGKAHLFDWSPLADRNVIIVADKDEPGRRHAATVKKILDPIALSVVVVEAKTGKDAADHIVAGCGLDDFMHVDSVQEDVDGEVPSRRARVTWASEIEPEPVVWAWGEADDGRVPAGSLSIAAGREGTGKSSFGIWLAAQITKGTLPGSFFGKPRRVFYVAVEDSWKHTLVPRLLASGADLSKIGRFDVIAADDEEVTLSLPHDNVMLEREVVFHDVALVVIDPLMSVIGEKIDTHREREVRSALDPLAKMADRTGSVFLGIAHFNKGSGSDAASLITGSGAFKNVPRSVFGFARDDSDDEGNRVMSQVKNSLGRDDLPSLAYRIDTAEIETKKGIATTGKFVFLGESDRSVAEILRDSGSQSSREDEEPGGNPARAFILEYLRRDDIGGEAIAGEILKAGRVAGFKDDDLKNARARSRNPRILSRKSGMATGWAWAIDTDEDVTKKSKVSDHGSPTPSTSSATPSPVRANGTVIPIHRIHGSSALAPSSAPLDPPAAIRLCGICGEQNEERGRSHVDCILAKTSRTAGYEPRTECAEPGVWVGSGRPGERTEESK